MDRLIVFARAPRLGQVKRRLAADVGDAAALEIYQKLLGLLFHNLQGVKQAEIACDPPDAGSEFAEVAPGWRVRAQPEGGLGGKLIHAFEQAFGEQAKKVVIIGSDCPAVTARHIRDAFRALNRVDAVFGPATDGGYWLVGLKRLHPELFQNIPWGTAEVLGASLAAARARHLSIDLLEILSDIDTKADWHAYLKQAQRQ